MSTDDTRRRLALYVLCVGMLMIVLDITVVNVALPSIRSDLRFSQAGLAWVVNAYMIAYGGLLLLAGRMGDLFGRRRIFLIGITVFTVASALCGAAPSRQLLVSARFLQGVGGALSSAVILGMIVRLFPEQREQAKAIGVYGFVASGGGTVGLVAGGIITQLVSWHWVFLVNIPIGIATALLAMRLIEDDPGLGLANGADYLGAVLVTGSLMLGVYTIVSAHSWALGGIAAVLLVLFIVREHTAAQPLMPLRLFRSRALSGANAIQMLSAAGMFGMFFLGALYLQEAKGYDALQIGLAFIPGTFLMSIVSLRYSDRIAHRLGARNTVALGLSAIVVALLVFTQVGATTPWAAGVLPAMVLLGLGAGACFPALMMSAMSSTGPEDSGLASGLVNTTAQCGAALGLAVIATTAAAQRSMMRGFHVGFWIAAAFLAASVLIAVVALPRRVAATEESPALEPALAG